MSFTNACCLSCPSMYKFSWTYLSGVVYLRCQSSECALFRNGRCVKVWRVSWLKWCACPQIQRLELTVLRTMTSHHDIKHSVNNSSINTVWTLVLGKSRAAVTCLAEKPCLCKACPATSLLKLWLKVSKCARELTPCRVEKLWSIAAGQTHLYEWRIC